ncbi:MAG: hypothetical protein ACI8PZ_005449 [Myxococcota bacterium]|jgi:hypothetical protein
MATTSGMVILLLGVLAAVVGSLLLSMRRSGGAIGIVLVGLFLVFLGERVFGSGSLRWPVTGLGVVLSVGSGALRVLARSRAADETHRMHTAAVVFHAVALSGLATYALTLEPVTGALGFDEAATQRWNGVFHSLTPLLVALGVGPMIVLDRVLDAHPRRVPAGLASRAVVSGLSSALVLSLLFPMNYLANAYNAEWDYAYFRTARPGGATISLVKALPEPVEVLLFFPPGNDVAQEIRPYFDALAEASDGHLTARVVDQALQPALSEERKIRENGYIALRTGGNDAKLKIDTDIDRAKRDLKKLDGNIYEQLVKITREKRTVYVTTGHGEANWREKENPLRKINLFKKDLEDRNIKVKAFGVTEGSTSAVPDDAAAVVVAAPSTPLLPEEIAVLKAYMDGGGRLLVLADPDSARPTELLDHIGVKTGSAPLAHAEMYLRQSRGKRDRTLLATNKFGSHASVRTLSRNSAQLGVIMPDAVWVSKTEGTPHKVSTLIRSFPDTWEDVNRNFELDAGEEGKTWQLAVAVELGEGDTAGRAIVVGDVNLLSDTLYLQLAGTRVFANDAVLWLVGDEDIAGEINTEEDVKIVHTRDEDQAWFWMTVAGVPFGILGLGLVLVRRRDGGKA